MEPFSVFIHEVIFLAAFVVVSCVMARHRMKQYEQN